MNDETTTARSTVPSERTRLRRLPEKAAYDRTTIDAILDAGLVGHVGVVAADGTPVVIPVAYARDGDRVLIHGSAASRTMRAGAGGAPMSFAVTLLDGMVIARSLFESSMAFRSVVVLGVAEPIDDPAEKLRALLHLSDRLVPGRVGEARLPTSKEIAATRVVALPLDEATAKVSDRTITDDDADLGLPIWAGFIPLQLEAGPAEPDPGLDPSIPVPRSVNIWSPERSQP